MQLCWGGLFARGVGRLALGMPPKKRAAATGLGAASRKRKAAEADAGGEAAVKRPAASSGAVIDVPPEDGAPCGGADTGAALAALTAGLCDEGWREALAGEFATPYFAEIARFVAEERSRHAVYPAQERVFEAFNLTPLGGLKVVVLGQDPYHEPGQAHGLCFSVPPGTKPPPSLKNVYKELAADVPGFRAPDHGHLVQWARQGVLLLNATLTVRGGHTEANSHSRCGWQRFTDAAIRVINERLEGVVFLLWGGFAQKKGKLVDRSRHVVIETAHPSPLSARKWHGCRVFSRCNAALRERGREEVRWLLD